MQVGVLGGICLLAFLLSKGRAEEPESIKVTKALNKDEDVAKEAVDINKIIESEVPDDLNSENSLVVTQSNTQDNEGRSGAIASSNSLSADSFASAVAQSTNDGPGNTSQAKAVATAGGSTVFNPFNEELRPYKSLGPSMTQAETQAISSNSYNLGQNSNPYYLPYPGSASNSPQALAEVKNGLYPPGYNPPSNILPYNQGPTFLQTFGNSDSGQPGIPNLDPKSSLNSVPEVPTFSSSYPYLPRLSSVSNQGQGSDPYQAVPLPSPSYSYDRLIIPYDKSSFYQTQGNNEERLQAVPMSDPYPFLIPYRDLSAPQVQTDSRGYLPNPIITSKQQEILTGDIDFKKSVEDKNDSLDVGRDQKPDTSSSLLHTKSISRAREYQPAVNETDSNSDLKLLKSGRHSYEYSYYSPDGPKYPSAADDGQEFGGFQLGDTDIGNQYSQRSNPTADDSSDNKSAIISVENEAQHLPKDVEQRQSFPIIFEDAKSRVISPNEYIFPDKMSGGENAIQCTKENEFHHLWSQEVDCLVCICLNEYGLLSPVCASCGGCRTPPPKLPEPIPPDVSIPPEPPEPYEPLPMLPDSYEPDLSIVTPAEEPYTPVYTLPSETIPGPSFAPDLFSEPVQTLPPQPAEASCLPLPTGEPFTNPLHPCQICVCSESYQTGNRDVQIECKENPQCIVPDDVTALPPVPDVAIPIPLPICEKFPEHVLFPHPTDTCKLCKCSKSISEDGDDEQLITCYPHPDCIPKSEPVTDTTPPMYPVDPYQIKPYPDTESIPSEPLREPFQTIEPVPLPELVTAEPLPWPPTTTIAPTSLPVLTPRPGPLPGPSPHESCRPFPPNQTFQHPWDECQLCMCTEATAVGMITVEVNCYTKPSCCIEPPESVKTAIPGYALPYPGVSSTVNGLDIQSSALQPYLTSTFRPPSIYPSYSPGGINIYPGTHQAPPETLSKIQGYTAQSFPSPISSDTGYVDPSISYPYQPNYPSSYSNPQYSEYPGRLPVASGKYTSNNFVYPNYQYAQGDAIGNYRPQGLYQQYDPRLRGAASPNGYPALYHRSNYEMPALYLPGQVRDSYAQATVQAVPNAPILAQAFVENIGQSKSGNDVADDLDESK